MRITHPGCHLASNCSIRLRGLAPHPHSEHCASGMHRAHARSAWIRPEKGRSKPQVGTMFRFRGAGFGRETDFGVPDPLRLARSAPPDSAAKAGAGRVESRPSPSWEHPFPAEVPAHRRATEPWTVLIIGNQQTLP